MNCPDITLYIYKGRYGAKKGLQDGCVASVPNDSRSTFSHQCCRSIKQHIEGYGFCTQHFKMIKDSYV